MLDNYFRLSSELYYLYFFRGFNNLFLRPFPSFLIHSIVLFWISMYFFSHVYFALESLKSIYCFDYDSLGICNLANLSLAKFRMCILERPERFRISILYDVFNDDDALGGKIQRILGREQRIFKSRHSGDVYAKTERDRHLFYGQEFAYYYVYWKLPWIFKEFLVFFFFFSLRILVKF